MVRRLRSVDTLLAPAVSATINKLTLAPEDTAAVRLAKRYAAAIDSADDPAAALSEYGPKLLACLESLGATPRARARLRKGGAPDAGGKLERFRATHQ